MANSGQSDQFDEPLYLLSYPSLCGFLKHSGPFQPADTDNT